MLLSWLSRIREAERDSSAARRCVLRPLQRQTV
jgi:hypothetical protein